jgi:hypothetical protein
MKYIKNTSSTETKEYQSLIIPPQSYELIPSDQEDFFKNDLDLRQDILNGIVIIASNDSGSNDYIDPIEGENFLLDNLPKNVKVEFQPAFASKILPNGSKIFRRKHGFSITIPANTNFEKILTVPYSKVKINEVEIINAYAGDSCDFKVFDSTDGVYQQSLGISPESVNTDLLLNQFGFNVYLPNGFYRDISPYDADLIKDMRIKINYNNTQSSEIIIYGNIIYHEIQDI